MPEDHDHAQPQPPAASGSPTSSKIFGRPVGTIELADDSRALIVTARRSPVAGAHLPTVAIYTRMRDRMIRFAASMSAAETRQLIEALGKGLALLEAEWQPSPARDAPGERTRGVPPQSWSAERTNGTSGDGAPATSPGRAVSSEDGGRHG